MKGFKEFLMRGNLVELAVAVVIGGVFANVVQAFTDMIMDVVGLVGSVPDFSSASIGGIGVGAFLSAVLAFLLTAFVVYFFVVVPYNRLSNLRKKDEPEVGASAEDLLAEIRDILREQQQRSS
jgi:large conductance mechanosensitive channel